MHERSPEESCICLEEVPVLRSLEVLRAAGGRAQPRRPSLLSFSLPVSLPSKLELRRNRYPGSTPVGNL
jgi:hypothetical protein